MSSRSSQACAGRWPAAGKQTALRIIIPAELASCAAMAFWACIVLAQTVAEEVPYGRGVTEANKERFMLDDMELEDVSQWYNGSPEETTLARSTEHVRQGSYALKFANRVDHTKGEKNYPVGWPRIGKDLAKGKQTDWRAYDFFECWIHVETSRSSLPGGPLSVGFYHSGAKRSSSLPLPQVAKDRWTKIEIPIAQISEPGDVQRVQFNIAESSYRHGDRVDFYVDDMVLTRFVEPAIANFALQRRMAYSTDSAITASYQMAGYKGLEDVRAELEIGPSDASFARSNTRATRRGELDVRLNRELPPGRCSARLSLRDREGKLIDRVQTEFRVIHGPF